MRKYVTGGKQCAPPPGQIGLNIDSFSTIRNRHKINTSSRRAGRPSMPSYSSDNQVLCDVLPHQVLREQTLQPAKLIFMLDLEVFEA